MCHGSWKLGSSSGRRHNIEETHFTHVKYEFSTESALMVRKIYARLEGQAARWSLVDDLENDETSLETKVVLRITSSDVPDVRFLT